jgi:hypothetical protein
MDDLNTIYKKDDVVEINGKQWIIEDIRSRWGREWVYDLTSSIDNTDKLSIPVDAMETIFK